MCNFMLGQAFLLTSTIHGWQNIAFKTNTAVILDSDWKVQMVVDASMEPPEGCTLAPTTQQRGAHILLDNPRSVTDQNTKQNTKYLNN